MKYALAHLKDGSFALPLFSPNIEHQVQELLSSIIKKRLTKPHVKGSNILQSTGLGMDIEASSFDNTNALSEEDKLQIVFEGKGKDKHIKYVEVYMPIHDTRLKLFADKNGNIGPERLRKLIDNGTIPESMLEFIAYRTPSDAEHSVIPCRIKGFVANTAGATIKMPKEIMVMTGHDYDGDKMRCHFKDFYLADKEDNELSISEDDIVKMVLGQQAVNPGFRKCIVNEYDYSKSAIENSQKARNNARVGLMFAQLTSPSGSRRVIIPGGCEETKVMAKTLNIIRSSKTKESKQLVVNALTEIYQDNEYDKYRKATNNPVSKEEYLTMIESEILSKRKEFEYVVSDTNRLYNELMSRQDYDLTRVVKAISGTETPYSITHAADAFDYIMGGSEMIGIYATYNSALQMLQRVDLEYKPMLTKSKKAYDIRLFGHQNALGKLFDIKNDRGELSSLGLARLLNAAVDNNKDPILGYLNQTKQMSEMTFFLFAAGLTEEEVHLLMNQPAVIELNNRLKVDPDTNFASEALEIMHELAGDNKALNDINSWSATRDIQQLQKDDYIRNLSKTYDEIKPDRVAKVNAAQLASEAGVVQDGQDYDAIKQQIDILGTLLHLNSAASDLSTFVRLTRPESESGAIGTSISDIIAKTAELDKFREKLSKNSDDIRISGMDKILEKRDVHEGWETSYISEIIGGQLPEVVALNSLMLDSSLDMFKLYFPQARASWVKLAKDIAGGYKHRTMQEGTIKKIVNDMILWKLLSNKKFVNGKVSDEQKRIVKETPAKVKALKERIAKAEERRGVDVAADALVGNAFLNNLSAESIEEANTVQRLRFSLNGPAVEGTRDLISASWGAMLSSQDDGIKQLAIDLFKYNLFTNGFGYGMYEFSHFAPFSVIISTPYYVEAMQDLLKSNWSNEADRENFINQYYMNHWGDKKFVPHYKEAALSFSKYENGVPGSIVLSKENESYVLEAILKERYVVLTSGENNRIQTLYRVGVDSGTSQIILTPAEKLGIRNRRGQATLCYSPDTNFDVVKPIIPANQTAWETPNSLNVYAQGNVDAPGMSQLGEDYFNSLTKDKLVLGLKFFGLEKAAKRVEDLEKKIGEVGDSNDKVLDKIPEGRHGVVKIISGGQTGVDTIGLQVARELGIETGGTAPKGFLREGGVDKESIKDYGLVEITDEQQAAHTAKTGKNNPYTGRTELNVINSDGTVYFATDDDSAGLIATRRYADEHNKPFLLNPSAAQLRKWLIDNNIGILNVAGNRGSKLKNPDSIRATLVAALKQAQSPTQVAPINIWFSSNENAELSNLAIRPFKFDSPGVSDGKGGLLYFGDETFNSVEQAFQLYKVVAYTKQFYAGDHYEQHPDEDAAKAIREAKDGYTARKAGRKAKNVDVAYWDANSSEVMKKLMKASFEQNPDAMNKLLATGNATLTHNQAEGKWKTEFPRLLMEVRDELRNKYSEPTNAVEQTVKNTAFGADFFGIGTGVDMNALAAAETDLFSDGVDGKLLNIIRADESGKIVNDKVPASPENVQRARSQKVFAELNKRLREILRQKGIDVGVLTNAEAMMSIGGIADFDTATVTAEGLLEMIRLANGYEGEMALPEEFSHVALEMLGHNHPLVSRLLDTIDDSDDALNEAYDGMYQEYADRYGVENRDKLVLEAAGKLVAKQLLYQEEIKTKPIRRLISRVVDAIKSLLRRFSRDEIQNAIFDANKIASKIAREMLGGRLLDEMSVSNINTSGSLYDVKTDISDKHDVLSKLLKVETKRLSLLKRRQGYATNKESSQSIDATEIQIKKLESAIKNYKAEDAIVTYMTDSLTFLEATRKSMLDTINSGRPLNSVCKKLNAVRDTLYSFSVAIKAVREAIKDNEIIDTEGIESSIAKLDNVLSNIFTEYEGYARTYFEEMLSNVYGKEGTTVEIGKNRGRKITIEEMARKADHDISMASRWFHALADCNDYVLKAIDSITRDAKIRARSRASSVRPRIEVAIYELEKETGSRDQSFMFETKMGNDGKHHRTGKYISDEASLSLPKAQKKFYDTIMSIKKDADDCLPESIVDNHKIVMMRKYTMDKFKDAEGAKGKSLVAWEGLKNRVMDTSDDFDPNTMKVIEDFEGNKIDMLPVKFVFKGKKESYDDMTDDVATSIMAYAGMAYEYSEMNSVIGILENAKSMSYERDVVQKAGSRTQTESVETDNITWKEAYTVKAANTRLHDVLEDFFQMHIYGHLQKNEGTIGSSRVSKRKLVDLINSITSYSQMALNIPQRIANINTGLTQITIESVGKGAFNVKDVSKASGIYALQTGDRLAETGKTDYDNKLSLWDEYFDVHQNNGQFKEKYKSGRMSRIFNTSLLYAGLTMGEDYLASTTSLALAMNYKVLHTFKNESGEMEKREESLWDAYEVKYLKGSKETKDGVGAYLSLKDGYTKLDGTPITKKDEAEFSKRVAGYNFELQGIYNRDDKSAVQQYAFGALLIMYRKWIAPALKRRYSDVNYNALKGEYQEGYHRTMFRMIGNMIKDSKSNISEVESTGVLARILDDMKAVRDSILVNWNKMTEYEKSNVYRSSIELGIVIGLWAATSLLGKIPPPDFGDDDNRTKALKWWDQTLMSQMLRLRTEIGSQAPTPMMVDEALHILKSPFAAIGPLQNAINTFQLLMPSNYMTEIKSGRYRGHTKAYKYFRELPIISMFKKVDNFLDPSPLINYYKNDSMI